LGSAFYQKEKRMDISLGPISGLGGRVLHRGPSK
jgi:hypothetical protein